MKHLNNSLRLCAALISTLLPLMTVNADTIPPDSRSAPIHAMLSTQLSYLTDFSYTDYSHSLNIPDGSRIKWVRVYADCGLLENPGIITETDIFTSGLNIWEIGDTQGITSYKGFYSTNPPYTQAIVLTTSLVMTTGNSYRVSTLSDELSVDIDNSKFVYTPVFGGFNRLGSPSYQSYCRGWFLRIAYLAPILITGTYLPLVTR
jgi:hypothetical protein